MTDSLFDLIQPAGEQREKKIFGVVIGIVTNVNDPEEMGRVKVRFPWLSESDESAWARVATMMAGNDRGTFFLPEVDDEVLVAFEHGDIRFPFVIGALWNGQDTPPESHEEGQNNRRTIKSRSGHIIRLDDTDGAETIEIIDKSGNNSIVINTADNTLTITADADITITSSNGKLILSGQGVEITSKAELKLDASSSMDVTATGTLKIQGATVEIN